MRGVLRIPTAAHRAIHLLALAACVWFAVHGALAAFNPDGSDVTIYYKAGRAMLEGRDPNAVYGFIYLPFFALCMAPIALLPYAVAAIAWQVASLAALVWIARACIDLVRDDGLPTPEWLSWAPLVCVLRLADSNFGNGQVNLLILAVVVAGARAWIRGRERSAGAWIGFAAALKILPAFLAIVFALRRAWAACAACAITALALVFLAPAVATGLRGNLTQIEGWWRGQTQPYLAGGDELLQRREYLPGQSLTPVVYRLLTRTPATALGNDGPSVNVADLDPESAKWAVRAAQVLYLALVVASILHARRAAGPGGGARLRELSIAICGALTLAPLVHKAHMVWLIVPYALLLAGAPPSLSRRARTVRWTLVALSFALCGLTTPAIFGRAIATSVLSHNAVFFGLQCAFAALLVDTWLAGPTRASEPLEPASAAMR